MGRYKRVYVVNPSIEWTNDQIQSSQPGSVPFTVCTKIMATALITIRSTNGGGTQFRRLLSVTTTPDWYSPEAKKQVRSALIRPVMQPRARRGLLQVEDSAVEPVVTNTRSTSGVVINVDRGDEGVTAASTLCGVVFGGSGTNCALFETQESVPVAQAAAICNAHNGAGAGLTLQVSILGAVARL